METKSTQKDVRMRFMFSLVVIMLAVDDLNPVKVICNITSFREAFVAWIAFAGAIFIVYANAKDLAYFIVKVFMQSILSIFFSSMEILGKPNIPEHGPVIFTVNHQNQFVDAATILASCPRRASFLIAEKSYQSRVVGDLAKMVGSIPVARPQDKAKKGQGRLYFDGFRIYGIDGTAFTALSKGDKIRPGRSAEAYRVKDVVSDTEVLLADDPGESSPLLETKYQGVSNATDYDILGHVDQAKVFAKVHEALSQGLSIVIFPEGGSHDQTDLLPLKVGVSAIAFGVLDKFGINVPIVPVGLSYFRGHRFRGRVVVEFGQPHVISDDLIQTFKSSKRAAYSTLLTEVEQAMRSVIVTAPTYDELKLIHTIRRIFQRSPTAVSTKRKQDIARRFSTAYKLLKEKYNGELPADLQALQKHLEAYQDELDTWGLRDYQVNSSLEMSFSKQLYIFVHGAIVLSLATIPSLILNAPVGLAASYWSRQEAKKDLKASRVKVAARDVMLSKKIVFSLVAVPLLWLSYFALLWHFSTLEKRTIVVLLLSFPMFSYLGVMAVEQGMIDLKDLRPAFLRLLPGFHKHARKLPQMRMDLQKELSEAMKKYGPDLGPVYMEQSDNWEQFLRKGNSSAELSELGKKDN